MLDQNGLKVSYDAGSLVTLFLGSRWDAATFGPLRAEVTFWLGQFAEVTFLLRSIVILPLGPKPAYFIIIIQLFS